MLGARYQARRKLGMEEFTPLGFGRCAQRGNFLWQYVF